MHKIKLYLDMCCYNRPFDSQEQMKIRMETEAKLYIQAGIHAGKYLLAWSYMLSYENSCNPNDEVQNAISPWKNIASEYCPSTERIVNMGQEIMSYGIHKKDALHLACAIDRNCDYFITTDAKLTNKTLSVIKIINPIDFIRETEETT